MCGVDDGKLRGHSAIFSKCSSREFLILSNASSVSYHRRIEINNKLSEEDSTNPVDSSYLSYTRTAKMGGSVSLTTDKKTASNSQHVDNKVSKLCGNGKSKQIEGGDSTFSELRLSI